MRILLDECLPARLRQPIPGHEVQTVPRMGWSGIKNGKLLHLIADGAKHEVFVTMDKSLPREAKIRDLPFASVVLGARSNRFEDTHPLMPEVLRGLVEFRPGQLYVIGGQC